MNYAITQLAPAVGASSLSTAAHRSSLIARIPRLSSTAAFYLLASITVSFLAGSAAPTPLYPLYQAEWGFSSVTTTIIFGIYALAVLIALLVAGRLSDHIGRRPVLIVATLAQAVTMLIFATADSVTALLIGRVIQGLAAGAAVAAVGAGLLDIDKARGTTANAIAPLSGTALGGLVAGLTVQFLPAPTELIYLALGVIFIGQAIGVMFITESSSPIGGAWRSLKPQFGVPAAVRGPMLFAIPALIATWSIAGFYGSLGPTLVRAMIGSNAPVLGGLALFVLAGSGGIAVILLQRRDARTMMALGTIALFGGVGVVLAALSFDYLPAFFVGTAIAGMGFGAAFQGAVRTVVAVAAPHERAGVLSVAFVVSYLAMGAPAVGAGYLISQYGDVFATAQLFGTGVMLLAALALIGVLTRRGGQSA